MTDRDRLLAAQDEALRLGRVAAAIRPLVRESWERSLARAVDPDRSMPGVDADETEFRRYRDAHELAGAVPVIRRLLVDAAEESGLIVAVGDRIGRLLWVDGDRDLRRRAESMLFVEGADWSEARVGTSAPGTALTLDRAVQIHGAEHFARMVHPWNCTAAPVHDPDSGAVLGVIDITGGGHAVAPHTLSLVSATVAAVEAELRIRRLESGVQSTLRRARMRAVRPPEPARSALRVLGRREAGWRDGTLGARHAEILTLLSWHPRGLTAERLADLLYESEVSPVTLRAEMARLRRTLGRAGERAGAGIPPVPAGSRTGSRRPRSAHPARPRSAPARRGTVRGAGAARLGRAGHPLDPRRGGDTDARCRAGGCLRRGAAPLRRDRGRRRGH